MTWLATTARPYLLRELPAVAALLRAAVVGYTQTLVAALQVQADVHGPVSTRDIQYQSNAYIEWCCVG
jgi:hypothetical protein